MNKTICVAVAAALVGLTACGNQSRKTVAETAGEAVAAVESQAREMTQADSLTTRYQGSDGLTRKIYRVDAVFYPRTTKARLSVDGKVYHLEEYPTASGFGYRNAEIDLRGKGTEATIDYADAAVRDLTLVEVTE